MIMNNFDRTMVALDLSSMDEKLICYSAKIGELLGVKKVYFLHAIPDFTMPRNADVEFQKLFSPEQPVDERVHQKIEAKVRKVFDGKSSPDQSIEVVEGKPYDRLLHWAEIKEIDLLVVGHKKESEGSGITPKRVARRSPCNLLFVPPENLENIQRILVPVDFSDNSARALQAALAMKNEIPEIAVQCIYIVDLPPADYYIRPFDNTGFQRLLLESAQEAYRDFLSEAGVDSAKLEEAAFIPNEYSNIAAHLEEYARQHQADLIVMGAKGHSGIENFIFGSITEKLVERSKEKPVLIVR